MNRVEKIFCKKMSSKKFKKNTNLFDIPPLMVTRIPNTINSVFEVLRKCIPTFPYERRLSKIDTLHLTISYIQLLQSIIESNLSLYDFLCKTLNDLAGLRWSNKKMVFKPIWATSGKFNF
jgi:hypothetical protein